MLRYGSDKVKKEILGSNMRGDGALILLALDGYLQLTRWVNAKVSSCYRPFAEEKRKGRSGIHGTRPHRAYDVVWKGITWAEVRKVCAFLNRLVDYGGGRKVAFGPPHGTAPHVHLQLPAGKPKFKGPVCVHLARRIQKRTA